MGIKVLFIYPNTFGMNMLPPAIATFSAILKNEGHEIQVFDTTYYSTDHGNNSDGSKEEGLNVVPFSQQMKKRGMVPKNTKWEDDVKKQVNNFKPNLIALSTTEDMWELGIRVIEEIKEYIKKENIPVIAGGVFPTFAPDICIKHNLIDLVCVGEGENALIDLCKKIENKEDYSDVTNLWIKKNGKIIKKNSITKPVDINKNPIIDRCAKDQRHGQFGCRLHHALSSSLKGSPVRWPGIIHSTFVIPPADPATSSHAVRITPLPIPDKMAIRKVRVARAMGMITIIRSTNRLPSSRSHSHSAA